MKKIISSLILILSIVVLTGCVNIVDDKDDDFETITITQEVTKADSRTDENAKKETISEVVPVNPKNVAVFDYGILDILDEVGLENLGIEKLAVVKSNLPAYLSKYSGSNYGIAGASLFEPSFDELDLFDADLVIISGRSAWAYNSLKKELNNVAVLSLAVDNTDYLNSVLDNMNILKQIFDGNTAFDALKTDLSAKTSELKETASQSGLKALIVMTNGSAISGYGIGSRFGFVHNELGFVAADDNFGNGDTNAHGDNISFEYISELNPDIIFVVDRTAATSDDTSSQILDVTLVNETNAGKNNRVILLDSTAWYLVSGGYNSTLVMIADAQKVFNR
jgi:iron complex transport system substrate-binding protein